MLFVLTGPESTAKSTLTQALSDHFGVPAIAEVARRYLSREAYQPSDLLAIAALQAEAEAESAQAATSLQHTLPSAFADTDLQVLYIWWQERFGPVPASLASAYAMQSHRYYFLCEPDIPWVADPMRENPTDRDRLFELYEEDLRRRGLPYSRIVGSGEARFECVKAAVEEVLGQAS